MQQGLISGVSKMFRRVVLVVLMLFVGISAADAAGYLCPTYRKYTSCNAGYYLNGTGIGNSCVKCPAGTYQPSNGSTATSCTKCAVGAYNTGTGNTACLPCLNGYTNTTTGSTSCGTKCANNNGNVSSWMGEWYAASNTALDICGVDICKSGYERQTLSGNLWYCNANQYTVKYNGNGSTSGSMSNGTFYYNTEQTLANNGFSRTGYTFLGWSRNSSATTAEYANAASVKFTTNSSGTIYANGTTINLYAVWKLSTYTCSAGQYLNVTSCVACTAGYYCPSSSKTYTYNGSVQGRTACATGSYTNTTGKTSCTACQNGTTTSGTGQTSCNATCSNATGAYAWTTASWSANSVTNACTISSCSAGKYKNGNACATCDSGYTSSNGMTSGRAYCYKTCADKTGYTLTGGVDYYSATDTCAYSANDYYIKYFCGDEVDGIANGGSDTVGFGDKYEFSDYTCQKTGYTQIGWANDDYFGVVAAGDSVTWNVAAPVDMQAVWQPNNYIVSFNANGGSGGQSANVTATYDNAMPTISTTKPTRAGYVFMGWYDNATYTSGTQYYTAAGASARTYNKTSNTTLYAGWAPCTAGYYCPAGSTSVTQNKCPGLYVNSLAASDANTDCYFTTSAGKYIASKDATTQTDCEYAYYCPSTKLYYPNTGSRQSCPDATTHKRTTFPTNYYATAIESTSLVTWNSNNKELITQCRVFTWITSTRGRLYEYATYNSSTGKYDTTSSYAWSDANPGYYLTTKSGCGTFAYYSEAKECPKNSYCPGKARVECTSSNQATVHTDNFGLNACTSLGSFYTTTASTGSSAASQCYGTTTAGKYIATANSSTQTTCEAGYACPSANVYYGSTGSRSKCTGATYSGNGASSCTSCPTATHASATGAYSYWIGDDIHDTVTGCYAAHKTTNASGTIIGNCFADENGVYGRSCNNFTGSTCNAGYYYRGTGSFSSIDAMFSGVCVDVGSGNYFAGGAVTWNTAQVPNSCSALGGIGVSGTNATYSSVSPRDTSKTCRFTAGAVTKTGCSSVVSNAVAYDGSNWGSNYYTAKAAKGYRVSSTDGANPSCTPCAAGTYQGSDNSTATTCGTCANWTYSGSGAASCTSCPTVTSGWSKVNSTGTGWDSYTDCQQTQKPANCASGAVVQTATSSSAWGASSVSTALTASANYYVNGVVCSLCSSLGGGLYKTSASGNSGGASACYATTEAGKYISATSNTAQQTCPAGDWCAGGVKLNWSATGGNTDCPAGYDDGTTGYSLQSQCTMNVPGGKYVKTANESSPSGTCVAGYAKAAHSVTYGGTSSCSECTGATYSTSDGASSCTSCPAATNNTAAINAYSYWNGGATGSHTLRSGCYVQFKNKTLDDGAMSLYQCYVDSGADTYGVNGTANSCWVNKPDLTCNGGYYNVVFNGNSAATQDTTNKTLTDLFANVCVTVGTGYWSADGAVTRTQCPANYRSGAAASAENQCVTSCGDGTYVATKNQACTSVGSGYFRAAHTVTYGSTSTRNQCPATASGSDGTRAANTNCYVGCSAKTISNGTTTVVNAKEYYSGSAYPACTFNVNCNAKYGASGNKTANPACTACAAGKYSGGGTAACTQCSNAPANSEYTGNAATNSCPWECKSGYNQTVDNQCGQFCTAGVTHIKLGNGLSIPLYSTARTAPAINIRVNDSVCYGSLTPGTTTDTTLRVKYEGSSYYAPEATE